MNGGITGSSGLRGSGVRSNVQLGVVDTAAARAEPLLFAVAEA
jgi:hypothetical protein